MRAGRIYTQSSADFYQVFFQTAPADGLHTSDYRMAGFGSIAWLAGVTKQLGPNLSIQFAAERSYIGTIRCARADRLRWRQLHLELLPANTPGAVLSQYASSRRRPGPICQTQIARHARAVPTPVPAMGSRCRAAALPRTEDEAAAA